MTTVGGMKMSVKTHGEEVCGRGPSGRKNILYKDSGSWEIAVCLCGQAVSSG